MRNKPGVLVRVSLVIARRSCNALERTQVLQICEHFRGQTVDFGSESLILQFAGGSDKLDAVIGLLQPLGIVELVRTGKILMARGAERT